MAQSVCMRCLSRGYHPNFPLQAFRKQYVNEHVAALSTTTQRLATPPKKKTIAGKPPGRSGRTLVLKKNVRVSSGRAPAPGERKASRRKIALNNPNAIDIPGLEELTVNKVAPDENGASLLLSRGSMLGIPKEMVESLTALETFRPTQGWNLFKTPATLIRDETATLSSILCGTSSGKAASTHRQIIYGEQGSGKSVLLLQLQTIAMLRGWIVFHIPDASELTNGHTAFQPTRTAHGLEYIQPRYTAKLLGNLIRANPVLNRLVLAKQHDLPIPIQANMSLARFAELGARDADLAWPIWNALWTELNLISGSEKGSDRPPILFTVDGVDHVMKFSSYLDADNSQIHAFDLSLVSHFISLLSGESSLRNGGMVAAAVSESNRASTPTFNFSLKARHSGINETSEDDLHQNLKPSQQRTSQDRSLEKDSITSWNPYLPRDDRVHKAMSQNVNVLKLQGLSKREARGILEYYAMSGISNTNVTDRLVSEKWSLAGSGIIGQLERLSANSRL